MRNFFIDLENVRSYGLEGILLLRPLQKMRLLCGTAGRRDKKNLSRYRKQMGVS